MTSRRDYYASVRDEPEARATIKLVESGSTERVVSVFSDFIVGRVFNPDSEAIQQHLSSDGEKLYAFDRVVRSVVFSGFLTDTRTSPAYAEWRRFYEVARASVAVRAHRVVEVTVRGLRLRGILVSSARSIVSANPHFVDLTVTMLCFSLTTAESGQRNRRTGTVGVISDEAAARVGLIDARTAADASGLGLLSGAPIIPTVALVPAVSQFEV